MNDLDQHLLPSRRILQRAYPGGVPDEDYYPLLAALTDDMSARALAHVVAELTGRNRFVVENDAASAASNRKPSAEEVQRVRAIVEAAGWRSEGLRVTPLNPQIRRWLDSGRASEAIVGADGFLVPSSTYAGEHDRILVLSELLIWAEDEARSSGAARAIEAAVERATGLRDAPMAYDIVWCYFVIVDDGMTGVPLSRDRLLKALEYLGRPADVSATPVDLVLDRVRQLPTSR